MSEAIDTEALERQRIAKLPAWAREKKAMEGGG